MTRIGFISNIFLLLIILFIGCDTMMPPKKKKSINYTNDDIKYSERLQSKKEFNKLPIQKKNEIIRKYNKEIEPIFFEFCDKTSFIKDLSNLYNKSVNPKTKEEIKAKLNQAESLYELIVSENNQITMKILFLDKSLYKILIENEEVLEFYKKYEEIFTAHYLNYGKGKSKTKFKKEPPYNIIMSKLKIKNENIRKGFIRLFEQEFSKKEKNGNKSKLQIAQEIIQDIYYKQEKELKASSNENLLNNFNEILKDKSNQMEFAKLFQGMRINLDSFKVSDKTILINLAKELGITSKEIGYEELIENLKNKFGELTNYSKGKLNIGLNYNYSKDEINQDKGYKWEDEEVKDKYVSNLKSLPDNLGTNKNETAELLEVIKGTIVPTQGNTLKDALPSSEGIKIDNKGCGIITALTALIFIHNLNKPKNEWKFPESKDIIKILDNYNKSSLDPGNLDNRLSKVLNDWVRLSGQGNKVIEFFKIIFSHIVNHIGLLPKDFEDRFVNMSAEGFVSKEKVRERLSELGNIPIMILNTSGENIHYHLGIYYKTKDKILIIETGNSKPEIYELDKYIDNKMEINFENTIFNKTDKYKETLANFFKVDDLKLEMKKFMQSHMIGDSQKNNINIDEVKYSIITFK